MVSNFAFLFATLAMYLNVPKDKLEPFKDNLLDIFSKAEDHLTSSATLVKYLNTPEVLQIAPALGKEPKEFIRALHNFILHYSATLY